MVEKDWKISRLAHDYPSSVKVFQQYNINVSC